MKITFGDCGGCFSFDLEAETMAEAALLARFGINGTKQIRTMGAQANNNGTFTAHVAIGKHRKPDNSIGRARR